MEDARTLFCKGLPSRVDKRDILELDIFRHATDCRIITNRETGENRGFCYIVFEREDDAEKAYEDRRSAKLDGRNLYLDFTGEKSQKKPPSRRYDDRRERDRYDDRRDERRRSRSPPRRERSRSN